jgi:hypothetical protein
MFNTRYKNLYTAEILSLTCFYTFKKKEKQKQSAREEKQNFNIRSLVKSKEENRERKVLGIRKGFFLSC